MIRGIMQVAEMKQALKKAGLRFTTARKSILESLAMARKPLSIQELATHTAVDPATIYRNIPTLLHIGLIEDITVDRNDTRYALAHGHHDHVVCNDCGKIEHIACTTPPTPCTQEFAKINHHEVTYYGLCKKCLS